MLQRVAYMKGFTACISILLTRTDKSLNLSGSNDINRQYYEGLLTWISTRAWQNRGCGSYMSWPPSANQTWLMLINSQKNQHSLFLGMERNTFFNYAILQKLNSLQANELHILYYQRKPFRETLSVSLTCLRQLLVSGTRPCVGNKWICWVEEALQQCWQDWFRWASTTDCLSRCPIIYQVLHSWHHSTGAQIVLANVS